VNGNSHSFRTSPPWWHVQQEQTGVLSLRDKCVNDLEDTFHLNYILQGRNACCASVVRILRDVGLMAWSTTRAKWGVPLTFISLDKVRANEYVR
jgi:hypothetical protein